MEDNDDIPGTVYLVDVAHSSSSGQHDAANKDIILVPQPSSDPEDPLNWSHRRKIRAVSMAYVYTLGSGIASSLQYSVLSDITADTGISTADLVQGTGVMFLFFGWWCLFWQPLALTFGRRGVYLLSMLLLVPVMVWTAYSSSAGEWYAHRIVIGIIVSPIESLPEVTVFDIFFAHNRGTYMGLYVFVLFGSNFLAPLVAGWFNDAYGWRWTMHFGAIIAAVSFVILYLFAEETMYFRRPEQGNGDKAIPARSPGDPEASPASGASDSRDSQEQQQEQQQHHGGEKSEPETKQSSVGTIDSEHTEPSSLLLSWTRAKPFRLMEGRPTTREMLTMMVRPVLMIIQFPCTAWSGFLYGINLSWYNVLNGTASPVLSSAPYNWSAALVGCVYAGPIIGAAAGCLWSGYVADRFALWMARRNGGVREAEHRLWPLAVSGVVSAAGLILWGVGADRGVHWVGLVFGLGLLTFGVVTGGSIAVAYNIDCFKDLGGETTVSVMIIRNTIGFGISYAITPWYTNIGLQNCFISAAMLSIACTFTFLLMAKFGKGLRKRSVKIGKKYLSTAPTAAVMEH